MTQKKIGLKSTLKKVVRAATKVKKESKRSTKTYTRNTKSALKAWKNFTESRELGRIERLLGEDFSSLKAARAALKRETAPVKKASRKKPAPKKPAPKKAAPKKAAPKKPALKKAISPRGIKITSLPEYKGKSFPEIYREVRNNPEVLDGMKGDDEYFYATYTFGDRVTETRAYENASKLFESLYHYPKADESVIDHIKILTVQGDPKALYKEFRSKQQERKAKNQAVRDEAAAIFGDKKAKSYKKTATDLLADAIREKQETDKRLAKLEADNAKMMKAISKLTKKRGTK